MLKKFSYNQMRFASLVSEAVYVLLALLSIFVFNNNEPLIMYIIKVVFLFLAVTFFLANYYSQRRKDNYADEMSFEHDLKASNLTLLLLIVVISLFALYLAFSKTEIALSSQMMICIVYAIYAIRDIYYLALERQGASYAGTENDD